MRAGAHVRLFGMSDQSRGDATFDDSGQPEKVYGQWISGDALAILGVKPALGRLLTPSDDLKPGQHPVAVLSYDFWSRRFGRNPGVLGRWVTIREKQLQIVGVAEKGFTGVEPGIMTDIWAPNMMWDDRAISDSGYALVSDLGPHAARCRAGAGARGLCRRYSRTSVASRQPCARANRATVSSASSTRRSICDRRRTVLPDCGRTSNAPCGSSPAVAVLVLLIACSNVASLLVARAASREREMALRMSIGAGRGRLIQQMLIESALLSIASCTLGALIAMMAAPRVVSMLSTSRSIVRLDLQLDWRLLVFLAAAGSLVTFLFGLAPAFRASAVSPIDALKSGSGKHTARVGLFRPLVAAQTAFSFVVLFVAGLCLASFAKLVRTDLGFDRNNLAIVNVEARELRQGEHEGAGNLGTASGAPRTDSPALSRPACRDGVCSKAPDGTRACGFPVEAVDAYDPWYLPVSPRFLETMRIRLVDGRDFEWRDAQPELPSAVIVNESFARRYFPGESPLGKRFFRVEGGTTLVAQDIIGVAGDAKYTTIRETTPPTVYDPYRPEDSAAVQVRTQLETGALAAVLRDELPRIHPAFRLADVTLQSTLVENTLVRDRALALLSAFFSVVAMVLVAVGLYGVLSYSVVQRTREIGIRLALGARPLRVVGLVLSEVGSVTAIGLVIGRRRRDCRRAVHHSAVV